MSTPEPVIGLTRTATCGPKTLDDAVRAAMRKRWLPFTLLAFTIVLMIVTAIAGRRWELFGVAVFMLVFGSLAPRRARGAFAHYLHEGETWHAGLQDGNLRLVSPLSDGVIPAGGVTKYERAGSVVIWKGPVARSWQAMPGDLLTDDDLARLVPTQ